MAHPSNSGSSIHFPDPRSKSSTIHIKGPEEVVDKVYDYISSFVQTKENQQARENIKPDNSFSTESAEISATATVGETPLDHESAEPPLNQETTETPTPNTPATSLNTGEPEALKSFRVSKDDSCYTILPVALKEHNVQGDWRLYDLYVVFDELESGNRLERRLELEEKPLRIFRKYERMGQKPVFMLRKKGLNIGSEPAEGSGMGGQDIEGSSALQQQQQKEKEERTTEEE